MVLKIKDLNFESWLGFVTGVLIFRDPQEKPKWWSWQNVYPWIVFMVDTGLYIDSLRETRPKSFKSPPDAKHEQGQTPLNFFIGIIHYSIAIPLIVLRVCLILYSTRFSKFVLQLEAFPIRHPQGSLGWNYKAPLLIYLVLKLAAYLYFTWEVAYGEVISGESLNILRVALRFIFNPIAICIAPYISLVLTVVTSRRLLWLYDSFCDELEEELVMDCGPSTLGLWIPKPLKPKGGVRSEEAGRLDPQALVAQFTELEYLFIEYDKLVGALSLRAIVTTFFSILFAVYHIPIFFHVQVNTETEHPVSQVIVFLCELMQFFTIEIGQRANDKFNERRTRLKPVQISSIRRTELRNLVSHMMARKWKMTACNFFTMQRSLLGGILVSTLGYCIILFQLSNTA